MKKVKISFVIDFIYTGNNFMLFSTKSCKIYFIIIHYVLILLLDNYWRELCMWNMLKKKGKVCENSYAIAISYVIIRDQFKTSSL